MAELRDSPRPDTYWPNTPSQWREPTVDDCTWYAVEFAFEAASDIHRSMHPVKDIREKSSDTVGGTPLYVALRDTDKIWPARDGVRWKYGALSRAEIRRALIDGKTVVWGGDYEKLPLHYRRWTNNDSFSHAMASRGFRIDKGVDQTFLYDPLGGGPTRKEYDGEWIPLKALYDFSWGNPTEAVGIVWGPGNTQQTEGKDKMIQGNFERSSEKYIDLPAGVEVYDAPNGNVFRKIWNPKRFDYFGWVGGGWWAIEVWNNERKERVIAYIKKGDYKRGNWPTPEPPSDPQLAEALAEIKRLRSVLADIDALADGALMEEPADTGGPFDVTPWDFAITAPPSESDWTIVNDS